MTRPVIKKEDIEAIECRFAVFSTPERPGDDDFHFVKEIIHTKSGEKIPYLRSYRNFERPFYVTRKGHQKHKDKKEWEFKDRLQEFRTRQSLLLKRSMGALEMSWFNGNMRRLARSPYLYGTDILSTAVMKRMYQEKFPAAATPYTVACFDTETSIYSEKGEIIVATISCGSKVYTAISKDFVKGEADVVERLRKLLVKYLGAFPTVVKDDDGKDVKKLIDIVKERSLNWEIEILDDETSVVVNCINKAHLWQPDFLAIWNITFDIEKVLAALERGKIHPAEVFSDPSVPTNHRFFRYKKGSTQKVTASGKISPRKPHEQWHTVYCPASFYLVDAMCAYRQIRTGSAEESSYSLDAILEKHLGARKLTFAEADHCTSKAQWHQFMQSNYKLEYIVYNVFDCIGMEMLDEKTKDLALSMPQMSGCSDFENFNSQPRRVVDELNFFVQKYDRIMGTTSDQMEVDFDKKTVSLRDWIVMLPAHLVADNGLQIIKEAPGLRTNIRRAVGDLDVSAS